MAEGEKGLKFGKLRAWTDTETQEAIDYIKSHNPALWRDVEQIEKTTGEFTDTAAFEDEYRLLMKLHPECESTELTCLYMSMRTRRRKAWGV